MTNEITDAQIEVLETAARKAIERGIAIGEESWFDTEHPVFLEKHWPETQFIASAEPGLILSIIARLRKADADNHDAKGYIEQLDLQNHELRQKCKSCKSEAKPELPADERDRFYVWFQNNAGLSSSDEEGYFNQVANEFLRVWQAAKADAADQIAELKERIAELEKWQDAYPAKCPITRRDFFMVIEHPELGAVPTYGGPYDSYTIPEMSGEPKQRHHERELFVRRHDHDFDGWTDDEMIPLRVIHEDVLFDLEDAAAQIAIVRAEERTKYHKWEVSVLASIAEQGRAQVERAVRLTIDVMREKYFPSINFAVEHILRELAEQPASTTIRDFRKVVDGWIEWDNSNPEIFPPTSIVPFVQAKSENGSIVTDYANRLNWSNIVKYRIVQPAPVAQQSPEAIPADTVLKMRTNYAFAIDGAISFGRMDINPPPSDDHWLMPFYRIGQELAASHQSVAQQELTDMEILRIADAHNFQQQEPYSNALVASTRAICSFARALLSTQQPQASVSAQSDKEAT